MTPALVPVTVEQARAVVGGDWSVLPATRGWPHADTVDALRPVAESGIAEGTFLVLLDGVVIGECGWFGPPDAAGEVEIGYGLAAPMRGHGHGAVAVRSLVAWVAARPGVRRVTARTDQTNAASRRLLERLGFVVDGADGPQVRYALDVTAT
ncbi:MAG TPA: GNAT family N-acetyltransferase [Frankiaceae bacterium]|nr:GNAT family N-acetyltransferase [Frankiaceae bacterium]